MKAKFITVKGRTKLVLAAENNQERVMMSNLFTRSKLDVMQRSRTRTKKLNDGQEVLEVVIEKAHYLSDFVIKSYGFTKLDKLDGRQFLLEKQNIGLFGHGTVLVVKNTTGADYKHNVYNYLPANDLEPEIVGKASTAEELDAILATL